MKSIRIRTDGTLPGTELFDGETGEPLTNVTGYAIRDDVDTPYLAELTVIYEGVRVEFEGPVTGQIQRYRCGDRNVIFYPDGSHEIDPPACPPDPTGPTGSTRLNLGLNRCEVRLGVRAKQRKRRLRSTPGRSLIRLSPRGGTPQEG